MTPIRCGSEGRVGSGIVGASARKLSIPPPWVWYRPSWGVPVETQAVMSMPASMAAEVANGLKRMCVIPSHAPASLWPQEARLHKLDNAGLLILQMRCEFDTCRQPLPGAEIESLRATSLILSGAPGRAARSKSHCAASDLTTDTAGDPAVPGSDINIRRVPRQERRDCPGPHEGSILRRTMINLKIVLIATAVLQGGCENMSSGQKGAVAGGALGTGIGMVAASARWSALA
jgi:hypothetical protein